MSYNSFVPLPPRSISKRTPGLRLIVTALVVIPLALIFLNSTSPAQAGSCAQDPTNLLLNGIMAPGPANQYGVVSTNWNAYVLSSNVPHFENAPNEGYDPNGSQYIWSDYGPFDAGIFQSVRNLTPGQTFHFWIVWGQSLQDIGGGNNQRTNQIDRQIGIDLTGGTNPQAPTVQWTVPYLGGSGFNRIEWNLYFKATGSTATFFLRSINYLTSGRDKVFFDTACLFPAAGSPTTTPWATAAASTPTRTPSPVATRSPTATKTATPTQTPTRTQSPGPSISPTATNTAVQTQTPTAQNTATPTPTATQTPVPNNSPTVTGTAGPPVAPTPADPSVIWDSRLPALNVSLEPANVAPGTLYWKLIRAEYDDPFQHCGDFGADHDMFYVLTDERGGRIVNQHVWQAWPDGSTDAYSDMRGIADIAIWSNYDPADGPGPYRGWVDGLPSDVVNGMGLPLKHHVSFILYFQRTIAAPYPTMTATPTGPWASPTPTQTPTLACTVSATVTSTPGGAPTATRTPTPNSSPSRTPTVSFTITPTPIGTVATATPPATVTPVACTIKSLATISVGAHPKGIAVDPATNRIFVGLADTSSVAVVDANTLKLLATWPTDGLGKTNGVAFAQNKVFVSKRNNGKVSVIDATTGKFLQNIAVGNAPYGIAASGARLWVSNFNDGTLSLLDATANTRLTTVASGTNPALIAAYNNRAYVTTFGAGVSDVDSSAVVLHAIAMGVGTFGVATNPLTNRVYTSNRNTNIVSVIDAASDTVSATLPESAVPYALAVNPNTNHLFVLLADSNNLRVRDGSTGSVVADIGVGVQGGNGGDSIAVLNNYVYVANNSDGTVSVIGDCAGGDPPPTSTPAPTFTPFPTSTRTPTGAPTNTPTTTPTDPPAATNTPRATATRTATPVRTATPTPTLSACTISVAKTISVGAHPKGIAVDPATNRIFVGLADASSVAVVDGNTLKLLATWPTDGLGNSNGVAFAQNKVFVTKRNNGQVSVIDATTGTFL